MDGELLVVRDSRVQSFNVLQQRLNRKTVTPKLLLEYPAHLRAYDLLGRRRRRSARASRSSERRKRLRSLHRALMLIRGVDLRRWSRSRRWAELAAARADPASAGAGEDANAVEGIMLKRKDAPYVPGRPKGLWWEMETRSAHR